MGEPALTESREVEPHGPKIPRWAIVFMCFLTVATLSSGSIAVVALGQVFHLRKQISDDVNAVLMVEVNGSRLALLADPGPDDVQTWITTGQVRIRAEDMNTPLGCDGRSAVWSSLSGLTC
jgi:hypothetical protein